jgi:hypothetical protein
MTLLLRKERLRPCWAPGADEGVGATRFDAWGSPEKRKSFKPKVASSNLVGRISRQPACGAISRFTGGLGGLVPAFHRGVNGGQPKSTKG